MLFNLSYYKNSSLLSINATPLPPCRLLSPMTHLNFPKIPPVTFLSEIPKIPRSYFVTYPRHFFVGNSQNNPFTVTNVSIVAVDLFPKPRYLYPAHLRIQVHPLSFHHHWMRHALLRFEVLHHSPDKHGEIPNRKDKSGSDHLDQPLLLSPHSSCLFLRLHWSPPRPVHSFIPHTPHTSAIWKPPALRRCFIHGFTHFPAASILVCLSCSPTAELLPHCSACRPCSWFGTGCHPHQSGLRCFH